MRTVEEQWNVTCSEESDDCSQTAGLGWGSRFSVCAENVAFLVAVMAVLNAILVANTGEPSCGCGGQWPASLGQGPWFNSGPIQVGFVMEKIPLSLSFHPYSTLFHLSINDATL
jgi:hypothetical protein